MLAYAYDMQIEAPKKAVPALAKMHEQACIGAGPQRCQVLGSRIETYLEDSVSARLSLRAEPNWLAKFRGQIETDTDKAEGRVRRNDTNAEDLTRAIVDTSAELRAKKSLRTRLEALLASRPGKLAELLEVERELARVQTEIDAIESNLAVMRGRVAMATLDINYESKAQAVSAGVFEPMADALSRFARIVIEGFAVMVTIVALLLPWLVVGLPVLYFGSRAVKRQRARKVLDRAKAEAAASPPSVG
jgi:hypothetical protein